MSNPIRKFKEKHIKHRFLYKLYRLVKYTPKTAYSSWGEDILAARLYQTGRFRKANFKGIYVDVGANHPVIGSTTYAFYKMGWRGLNLDLTADNILLHKRLKRRDVSVQCGISDEEGELEAYIFDQGSGLNTLDKAAADEGVKLAGKPYRVEKIKTLPLNKAILDNLGDVKIDLLNLDVEGHELTILKTFDFERFHPDVITCEIHGKDLEEVMETEVYKLIKSKNYHCYSYAGGTALFAHNDFDYVL